MGLLTATSNKVVPLPPAKYWCRGCSTSFLNWSSCLQHVRSTPHPHDPELYFLSTTKPGRRQLQELCKLATKSHKTKKGSPVPIKSKKMSSRRNPSKIHQNTCHPQNQRHHQKRHKPQNPGTNTSPRKPRPRIQPFDNNFGLCQEFNQMKKQTTTNMWQNRLPYVSQNVGEFTNYGLGNGKESFPPLSPLSTQSSFSCESTDCTYSTTSDCSSMTCDSATESCSLSNRFADLGLLGVGGLDVFDVPALQEQKLETETNITKTNNEAEKSKMSNAGLSILNALPLKPAFCVVQFLEDADCDNLLKAY